MKAEINEFIGVFDNTVPNEYCDSLIDFFDRMQNIGKAVSRAKYTGVSPVKQDNSLYYFINEYILFIGKENSLTFWRRNKNVWLFYPAIITYFNIYTSLLQ